MFKFESMQSFIKDAVAPHIIALKRKIDNIGIKKGMIMIYHGEIDADGHPYFNEVLPDTLWHICDGTTNTLNLSELFDIESKQYYIERIN